MPEIGFVTQHPGMIALSNEVAYHPRFTEALASISGITGVDPAAIRFSNALNEILGSLVAMGVDIEDPLAFKRSIGSAIISLVE